MKRDFARDFYEVQRQQWKKSLLVLLALILFYFFAVGLVLSAFALGIGFFLKGALFPAGNALKVSLLVTLAVSAVTAVFHFYDAKKFGARFIRNRLQAHPPDPADRYHKKFMNTLEEIRIASGLPEVRCYILPQFSVNSMALIEADSTPSVIVTEGLLAEFTRHELQAVIAHELAHIIRGDTFYITLICSLANVFERMRQALEPDEPSQPVAFQSQQRGGAPPLLYIALTLSAIIMHLLSTLISRQRELLADATAAELTRDPKSLAGAVTKAHLKNSFVGDFNLTYSPLLIVPPRSGRSTKGFFSRLFNSHPPLMQRIGILSDMAHTKPSEIIKEVWEIQRNRDRTRTVLHPQKELVSQEFGAVHEAEETVSQEGKTWMIRDPRGTWTGPYALDELVFLDTFTPLIRIKNLQENIEAPAREFPHIQNALRNIGKKKSINPSKQDRCPRCRIPLHQKHYEGVSLKTCPDCGGKLVDSGVMHRIIVRKEFAFSDALLQKAQEFKRKFMLDPVGRRKINSEKSPRFACPNCGARMRPRPYNYNYIIPVDKCLSCSMIWFDPDELEILQILIETR
jgi:Zn-dependent protease with chaperone function/Zn-finger nucleic acid-binding protein